MIRGIVTEPRPPQRERCGLFHGSLSQSTARRSVMLDGNRVCALLIVTVGRGNSDQWWLSQLNCTGRACHDIDRPVLVVYRLRSVSDAVNSACPDAVPWVCVATLNTLSTLSIVGGHHLTSDQVSISYILRVALCYPHTSTLIGEHRNHW
jgi:hypothetical protein